MTISGPICLAKYQTKTILLRRKHNGAYPSCSVILRVRFGSLYHVMGSSVGYAASLLPLRCQFLAVFVENTSAP